MRTARKSANRARRQLAEQLPDHTAKVAESARKARETAQAALAERAGQAQEVLTEHWGPTLDVLAERWGIAQDVLADRILDARRELAARIEPEPQRRRRWPWLVLVFLAAVGAIGAVLLARRPQETEPEPFLPPPAREPGSRDSDPDISENAQASNGVVSVERPSANTD